MAEKDEEKQQEQQQQEKEKRVEMGDVLKVLAKHAARPNDPDDANTLDRWNQQVAEEQGTAQDKETEGREQQDSPESPQGGSQPTGTARGSSTGARREKP